MDIAFHARKSLKTYAQVHRVGGQEQSHRIRNGCVYSAHAQLAAYLSTLKRLRSAQQRLPPLLLIRHSYIAVNAVTISITPGMRPRVNVTISNVTCVDPSTTCGVYIADHDHKGLSSSPPLRTSHSHNHLSRPNATEDHHQVNPSQLCVAQDR